PHRSAYEYPHNPRSEAATTINIGTAQRTPHPAIATTSAITAIGADHGKARSRPENDRSRAAAHAEPASVAAPMVIAALMAAGIASGHSDRAGTFSPRRTSTTMSSNTIAANPA